MKLPLYSQDGKKTGDVEVSDKIFNQKVNHTLIHRLLTLQLANRRNPVAHTKTKGEVRGGGKKPYAQKHTGRARQGSIRNPHYIGGGVAFGPNNMRNFELHMPKKARRKALFGTLSAKAKDKLVLALESFTPEKPKTKTFVNVMKNLKLADKDILFVLPEKNKLHYRVTRNIPNVKTILVNYLNVGDLLRYHHILFLKEALPKIESIFLKS